MLPILKSKSVLLFLAVFLIQWTACNSNRVEEIIQPELSQEFVLLEGPCCINLRSIEEIELTEVCKPNYDFFYAINLDEFNISQNYSIGDTLSISFDFEVACEASGTEYNCVIECDIRHGVPIRVISVD